MYRSGVYRVSETVFDSLEIHGITIPRVLQFHDYQICLDIECSMSRDIPIENSEHVSYEFKHEIVSISVCSNVPGFTEPRCFVSDGCPKKLVKEMLAYMLEISEEASQLQRGKFADYLPQIEALDEFRVQDRLDKYLDQTTVLTFNGTSYDLKVMKEQLISVLLEI